MKLHAAWRSVLVPSLLALAACTSSSAERAGDAMHSASPVPVAHRIVVIGLDAADWLTIDPMIEAGTLPVFSRLKAAGRVAVMVSTPPLVSPILWTTIATGLLPDKHGVLDFMVDLPGGGQTPVRSTDRRGPALWNLFSGADRSVAVIGWWATWPAEHVRGTVVTDAVAPQLVRGAPQLDADMVWPEASLHRTITQMVRPSQLTYQDLRDYVPLTQQEFARASRDADATSSSRLYENPLAHLATIVASTRTYTTAAVETLRAEHPDFLAVYFETIDSVSHLFIRDALRGPRAIARAYRDADDLIRRLAEASPPDTVIVICSDHGFYPRTAGIAEDPANLTGAATAWHRPYGIAAVATAGVLAGRTQPATRARPMMTITPIDIAPTVLHAAALSVTTDMTGRVVTDLLADEASARPVQRVPPPALSAPRSGESRLVDGERARLQSLGYIAAAAPKTSLARQNLGEVLYRRGDFPRAEKELRGVLEAQPSNLTATLWLAKALAAQSRPAEALVMYQRAVVLPGGAHEAVIEAVTLAIDSGRRDTAQALIAAASRAPDAVAAVAVARGDLAESAGKHPAAERAYREAMRIDPLSFDAAARLLEQLVRGHRPAEAVAMLESAVKVAPDSPRHLALLGEARLRAADAAGAERALARALQLVPDGALVRLTLARAQLIQHKTVEAVQTLNLAPVSGERQALLGAAFAAQRKWADATSALEDATRLGMATPDVLNQLGWAFLQLGQRDRAKAALTQSLGQNPNQAEIRKLITTLDGASPGIAR